ncbi:hypothetical protein ACVW19_001770 [Streptomyces sp. TE5632]
MSRERSNERYRDSVGQSAHAFGAVCPPRGMDACPGSAHVETAAPPGGRGTSKQPPPGSAWLLPGPTTESPRVFHWRGQRTNARPVTRSKPQRRTSWTAGTVRMKPCSSPSPPSRQQLGTAPRVRVLHLAERWTTGPRTDALRFAAASAETDSAEVTTVLRSIVESGVVRPDKAPSPLAPIRGAALDLLKSLVEREMSPLPAQGDSDAHRASPCSPHQESKEAAAVHRAWRFGEGRHPDHGVAALVASLARDQKRGRAVHTRCTRPGRPTSGLTRRRSDGPGP